MKINVTSIAVSLTTIGLAVFGFSGSPSWMEVESTELGHESKYGEPVICGTPKAATVQEEPDALLSFWVRGKYVHSTSPSFLKSALRMNDIISDYPSSLIEKHLSVKMTAKVDGKELNAIGQDVAFNQKQKQLLKAVQLGNEIQIDVKFKSENPVTHKMEEGLMNYIITVIPEQEAEYPGGYDELMNYLRKTGANEIPKEKIEQIKPCLLHFTVSENGYVGDVEVRQTSGLEEVDEILLKLARNMSPWKAAKTSNGTPAKQSFELHVLGMDGC